MQQNRRSSPLIPLHLLNTSSITQTHIRCYSSQPPKTSEYQPQRPTEDANTADPPSTSRFADAFGFQSLRGLFYQPQPRNRYSRSREPEPGERAPLGSESSHVDSSNGRWDQQLEVKPSVHHFTPSIGSSAPPASDEPVSFDLSQPPPSPRGSQSEQTVETTPMNRSRRTSRKAKIIRFSGHGVRDRSLDTRPEDNVKQQWTINRKASGPWGLSQEDTNTINSLADPGSGTQQEPQQEPSPQNKGRDQPPKTSSEVVTHEKSPQSQILTHVNSSGEAHMVDVGAKLATKRTAIACACVTFSNAEPFRLIFENTNKKGDVLGVARIAGIMGAKRTSDLIPLCHPINISKINVDVKLLTPESTYVGIRSVDKHGAVEIEALVESVGATGVEMEALTATMVAATTVFDMCKAVDRDIGITASRVVYKSGGKSGTHCYRNWARYRGREFFRDRGLEIPPFEPEDADSKSQNQRK